MRKKNMKGWETEMEVETAENIHVMAKRSFHVHQCSLWDLSFLDVSSPTKAPNSFNLILCVKNPVMMCE